MLSKHCKKGEKVNIILEKYKRKSREELIQSMNIKVNVEELER